MANGKGPSFQVRDFYQRTKESLKLRVALGKTGFERRINPHSFQGNIWQVQVWGKEEAKRLKSLSSEKRKGFFRKKVNGDTACVVLAEGLAFFPEIEAEAKKRKLALFQSELNRRRCRELIKRFFVSSVRSRATIPGGLIRIFGLGVLIKGDSGIGKSESALELISRGHKLISDDVTQVMETKSGKLIGQSPPLSRYFMEIRGLGIINIKEIFGEKAIGRKSELNIIIHLKKWEEGIEYDRLGLKFPQDTTILGQKIPQINIPVGPGRNIATLIEIACKVHILRQKGYFAPHELTRKLKRALVSQ